MISIQKKCNKYSVQKKTKTVPCTSHMQCDDRYIKITLVGLAQCYLLKYLTFGIQSISMNMNNFG